MDTFYHGEPSPSPHQHQHHHDPYEHGGDEDHDHDGIPQPPLPPPYEDTEEAPPEIETAYSEARARGLPDGWTCSIDVCITRSLTTTITMSCPCFAHFFAAVVTCIVIVDDYKLFLTAETESS